MMRALFWLVAVFAAAVALAVAGRFGEGYVALVVPSWRVEVSLLFAVALPLCSQSGAAGGDWPTYGGTYSAWRYSALAQVNRDNVQKLAPAWVFQTGDYENGLQATPIVVDGVLYLSTSNSWVFALDGASLAGADRG